MPLPIRGGSLADLRTLMGHPPRLRRGYTAVDPQAQPAAGGSFIYTVDSSYWRRIVSVGFTFTTAATASPRTVYISYANGDGIPFNSIPVAATILGSMGLQCFGDIFSINSEVAEGSATAEGAVTTPTAGQVIAQVPSVPPGFYTANWIVELSGTPAAGTDNDNFNLTTGVINLAQSSNEAVVGDYPQDPVNFEVNATTSISIKAKNAGTAGAVYQGSVAVTAQGSTFARIRLPDIVLQPGWQFQINLVNANAADQISSVVLFVEHYASDWASGTDAAEEEALLELFASRLVSE
jgi:hypothetical protein